MLGDTFLNMKGRRPSKPLLCTCVPFKYTLHGPLRTFVYQTPKLTKKLLPGVQALETFYMRVGSQQHQAKRSSLAPISLQRLNGVCDASGNTAEHSTGR